jgi:ABC-type antimicrobial peptide transport system permease subunit
VKNYSISGPPEWADGEVYLPLAQSLGQPSTISLVARLNGDTSSFERSFPKLVAEVCATCAVSKVARMKTLVSAAVEAPRSMAWLVGGFAMLALGLAAIGIYGVVSHGVLRRTRELGVRLALGASRGRVAWLVVGSILRYALLGAVAGLACAWALARWITTLLYGVGEHDLISFSVPPLVLIAAGLTASLYPVYRAVTIDPARSLREG